MAGSSHGHTPAAWTGVIIAFIGFCVAGAFMVMAQPLGFWAGMAIVVLGGVVGVGHARRWASACRRSAHPVQPGRGDARARPSTVVDRGETRLTGDLRVRGGRGVRRPPLTRARGHAGAQCEA